jgi:lipopolysaccharide assembly outer membrane protein LptD (OstA)
VTVSGPGRAAAWACGAVALLAGLWAGPPGVPLPAGAAPAASGSLPALQGPLNVTADEIVVDNTGAGLTARGHVRLTYEKGVATANVMHLRRGDRTAEFIGNVVLTDPHGKAKGDDVTVTFTAGNQVGRIVMAGNASAETKDYSLQADHVTADRSAGRLVAEEHITMFMAPDLIVNGDRAVYNQAERYGVVSGHVAASNRAGRMTGDWVEFYQQKEQAVVHGPVTAEVYGATITSNLARMDFRQSTAVFTGHVLVTRRQGTLTADRVTIFYKTRRLVAEGATHAHLTGLESGNP